MENEFHKLIDGLNLPQSVKEDLEKRQSTNHAVPEVISTKKMVSLASEDGRKAAIIMWEDDFVTVISTDKGGESHVSTSNSPDHYQIAMKHYIDLGLEVIPEAN